MITQLDQINLETTEGKLLMAAIAKITTESQTDKIPEEVIQQLNELSDKMIKTGREHKQKNGVYYNTYYDKIKLRYE